jgi:hypothetical protein
MCNGTTKYNRSRRHDCFLYNCMALRRRRHHHHHHLHRIPRTWGLASVLKIMPGDKASSAGEQHVLDNFDQRRRLAKSHRHKQTTIDDSTLT